MMLNGRMHDPQCGSVMGSGTNDCEACHSVLCAICEKEVQIERWPAHRMTHRAAFCNASYPGNKSLLLLCSQRAGHNMGNNVPHMPSLRLMWWWGSKVSNAS